ncbi:DNA methyltransferase 1-associated protein 1, partial [Paragonimus westermani]
FFFCSSSTARTMSGALDVFDILDLEDAGPKKSILDRDTLLARTEKVLVFRPFIPNPRFKEKNEMPKCPTQETREHTTRSMGSPFHIKQSSALRIFRRLSTGYHSPYDVFKTSLLHTVSELPPLMPTDDALKYKQPKAVIGVGRVRRWHWTPFTNPARQHVTVPEYTSSEYGAMLQDPKWSKEKTAHLMELARRFDLRFIHMRDRWDSEQFPERPSIEDLKERYYAILAILDRARGTNLCKGLRYDAAHERRRKQQLSLLYGRTKDQVEEEQCLIQELRKIEARRRERERKKQDLQKLISQADTFVRDHEVLGAPFGADSGVDCTISTSTHLTNLTAAGSATSQRKRPSLLPTSVSGPLYAHSNADSSVSLVGATGHLSGATSEVTSSLNAASTAVSSALASTYLINFPDPGKNPGVHLRSQKMKLPSNLGQKKIRIIENFLAHLQIDPSPPATADIVEVYNNLRSKILLLYDLRMAQLHCDYELQSARLKLDTFAPDQVLLLCRMFSIDQMSLHLQPLPAGLAGVTVAAPPSSTNSAVSLDQFIQSSTSSVASLIDSAILNALRDSDSKRPPIPRHSLGVAGALTAAAGSLGLANTTQSETVTDTKHNVRSATTVDYSPRSNQSSDLTPGRSPAVHSETSFGSPSVHRTAAYNSPSYADSMKRRRRAAALEQGRVLKKLKTKGHLIE